MLTGVFRSGRGCGPKNRGKLAGKLKTEVVWSYLRDERTPMVLLRLHVGDLSAGDVACDSDWAASVHDLAAAAGVLQRVEMFADLAVVSVRVDCLVLVEARDGPHLLLHRVLCLELRVLGMVVLMAVDDDRWRSVVLVVVANVDVRPRRSLRVIMVISSAVNGQKHELNQITPTQKLSNFLFTNFHACCTRHSSLIWVPKCKNRAKIIYKSRRCNTKMINSVIYLSSSTFSLCFRTCCRQSPSRSCQLTQSTKWQSIRTARWYKSFCHVRKN